MIDTDQYVDFLCKAGLTPNQFFICWLIHNKDIKNIIRYQHEVKIRIGDMNFPGCEKTELEDLLEREYLLPTNPNKKTFDLDELFVTPKFTDYVCVDDEVAGEEFFNAYPSFILINGVRKSARSFGFEETIEAYAKIIKGRKWLHEEIMEILNWYKGNDEFAEMGIKKFLGSRYWNDLKLIRDGDTGRAETPTI